MRIEKSLLKKEGTRKSFPKQKEKKEQKQKNYKNPF